MGTGPVNNNGASNAVDNRTSQPQIDIIQNKFPQTLRHRQQGEVYDVDGNARHESEYCLYSPPDTGQTELEDHLLEADIMKMDLRARNLQELLSADPTRKNYIKVFPQEPVQEVAEMMARCIQGTSGCQFHDFVFVVDHQNNIQGLVTRRDVIKRGLYKNTERESDLEHQPISEIMTPADSLRTVQSNRQIVHALHEMSEMWFRYRHVIISESKDQVIPTAVVSLRDVANFLWESVRDRVDSCLDKISQGVTPPANNEEILEKLIHGDVYSVMRDALTLTEENTINDAINLLCSQSRSSAVVTNHSGLIRGIVTESDIMTACFGDIPVVDETPIGEIIAPPVHTIAVAAKIQEAVRSMFDLDVGHLVVTNESSLPVGVLSFRQIVEIYVGEYEQAVFGLDQDTEFGWSEGR